MARRQHHVRQWFGKSVLVLFADHARLEHRRMLDQRVFDFDRTDPDAANLEHVVAAAGVPQKAVLVFGVLVASTDPLAFDGVARLVVLVPVARTRGVALNEQVADFADRHRLTVIVEDPRLVARYGFARRAGPD